MSEPLRSKDRNQMKVGMFVIVGFILLTLTVFFVSGVYFFRSGYNLTIVYEYVSILDKGAPVRMSGVRIGEVSNVRLIYDEAEGKTKVEVKLFIEKGVEIRENYLFNIRGTHILSEPHIEVSPLPGGLPILSDGAVITGVEPTALESLIDKANSIASQLDEIFTSIRGAVQDEESQQAVRGILINLAKLTESLSWVMSGSEEDMKMAMIHMRQATESLSVILAQVEEGDGTLGKLFTDDKLYEEMRGLVAEIKARPWRLLKKDDGDKKFLGVF